MMATVWKTLRQIWCSKWTPSKHSCTYSEQIHCFSALRFSWARFPLLLGCCCAVCSLMAVVGLCALLTHHYCYYYCSFLAPSTGCGWTASQTTLQDPGTPSSSPGEVWGSRTGPDVWLSPSAWCLTCTRGRVRYVSHSTPHAVWLGWRPAPARSTDMGPDAGCSQNSVNTTQCE